MYKKFLPLIILFVTTTSYSGELLQQLEGKIHTLLTVQPEQVNKVVMSHYLISDLSKICEKTYLSENMPETLLKFIQIKNNYLSENQIQFDENLALIKMKTKETQKQEGFNVELISQYYLRKLEWSKSENKALICNGLSNMISEGAFATETAFPEIKLNEVFAIAH